ncbi:NAD(P)/FAD-dependent oxidoreductase [Brevibacterium renqingii]|uniref:NAD(P)/FAD-dependent oxidoreductase n=1 Tax=Brevibacterium renqingii TaxID=2776916 RepID=UPI001ADEC7A4|nr:FAD-binding oxidoreductase [Brevibacterium renqingii]
MHIIVIGSGLLGLSTADTLCSFGAEVTLVDARDLGAGTSGTSFAWTNANGKLDPAYHALNVAGMKEHARLAESLEGPRTYFRSGGLQLADARQAPQLEAKVARLRELGYPTELLDVERAVEIAGDIRVPAATELIAHFPTEGYVHNEQLLRNLRARAIERGAKLIRAAVVEVDERGNGVDVRLGDERVLTADRVVLATGRWTSQIAAASGFEVPMNAEIGLGSAVTGLLGYVRSSSTRVNAVVHTPGLNLRPGEDGTIVVQALDLNPQVDPDCPPTNDGPFAEAVAERFAAATTGEAAEGLDLRLSYRSLPADGLTIAGYVPGRTRTYCLVTHSGITLGPLLGRLAAEEVADDRRNDLLEGFRPERFDDVGALAGHVGLPTQLGDQ